MKSALVTGALLVFTSTDLGPLNWGVFSKITRAKGLKKGSLIGNWSNSYLVSIRLKMKSEHIATFGFATSQTCVNDEPHRQHTLYKSTLLGDTRMFRGT